MGVFGKNMMPHDIVYWDSGVKDGYSERTWDSNWPIEIKGRWEKKRNVITGADGKSITSSAVVYVDRPVDAEGWLFLGTTDDLDSALDPQSQDGAYEIIGLDTNTNLRGNKTIYKVFLT